MKFPGLSYSSAPLKMSFSLEAVQKWEELSRTLKKKKSLLKYMSCSRKEPEIKSLLRLLS